MAGATASPPGARRAAEGGETDDGSRPDGGADGGRVSAAERGATSIADRVVAKIAARAAREALGAAPGTADRADQGGGLPPGAGPPRTTVVVHRDSARVHVSLELGYPCDLAARCAAVRRQVTRRVETLAGLAVQEVAVHVERLHSAQTSDKSASGGRVR
ncbi:Asp23/Gls24 family envelope stress response protein [Streptomyces lichenis]|uniref:Asp23/Gls24 family envelope stress response protein n=1 Tax=Streptomyces lichenis TaxID=2306967 RepID=A0ABT0ICD4_9ACTN|nr:Asp23/Gls24 family envelope stress response protein [Streptomyces lichenis]MCK8678976.1 Asp23/Gls24 family envelope stress response protein [Streptomyces lichenis]